MFEGTAGILIGLLVGMVLIAHNVEPSMIIVVCCFSVHLGDRLFRFIRRRIL